MVRWRKSKTDESSSAEPTTTSVAQATAERPAAEKPAEQPTPAAEQAPPAEAKPAEKPAAEEKKPAAENTSAEKPAAEKPAEEKKPAAEKKPAPKKEAPVAKTTEEKKPGKGKQAGEMVVAGTNALRTRIASLIWLVAVVCALFLAVGALLVALKANRDNAIVAFVLNGADALDLGVFSRRNGIFTFDGKGAVIKDALVNWGIGAIAYLVVGKVLDRIIRP